MSGYLMIENPGVAPIEGLTLFGASLTRNFGSDETIGQFGSGSKHAINLLMRNDICPIIYCGQLRLEFFAENRNVKDELNEMNVRQVSIRVTGKDVDGKQINRTEKLSWTLEHGVYDWNNVGMAIREFVSNAIDRSVREFGNYEQVKIELVKDKEPRAKTGGKHTRVFIPLEYDVEKYYRELGKRFLHFSSNAKEELNSRVLNKKADRYMELDELGCPKGLVYRNGVFIKSVNGKTLFDYNFDKTFKIDESRNSSDYVVNSYIANYLIKGNEKIREVVLREILAASNCYEFTKLSFSDLRYCMYDFSKEKVSKDWQDTWSKVCGAKTIIGSGTTVLDSFVKHKGYHSVNISSSAWKEFLKFLGIKTEVDVLTKDELAGREIYSPTTTVLNVLDHVWDVLHKQGLLNGKEKPKAFTFKQIMEGGSKVNGEYRDGQIYIEENIAANMNKKLYAVVLEEVIHHITGSHDNTRDLQDFMFRLVTDLVYPV